MDKIKIAWLWLIRENQPVSLDELIKKLVAGETKLPVDIREFESSHYIIRAAMHEIEGLIKAGLVRTDGPTREFWRGAKLECTPMLDRTQDIFSISLTSSLKWSDSAVTADSIFGKPSPGKNDEEWARIFVAMPFKEELIPVYKEHILKVTKALNLTCKRGDDFFNGHSIMQDVWSAIYHADICIVDCTGRNPNVFYELGMAHTLGRKTIVIAQSMDDIPFDVRHLRVIEYQYAPPGMKKFEAALKKTLKSELNL